MSCILCFTQDTFQEKLRTLSQCRFERFEDTLEDYQNNLLSELENLSKVSQCPKHLDLSSKTKDFADKILGEILELKFKVFCNRLREIYIGWISKTINPIDILTNLLEEHELLNYSEDVKHHVFFRGRKSKVALTKDELFHIPFNKRSIIKNQRYSITGQPILYLALSPLSIVKEIRQELSEISDIYFCSYLHKDSESLKVFDNINRYPEKFSDADLFYLNNEPDDLSDWFKPPANDFYKFLFIQFCSFKRPRNSEEHVFCEEYVLPQILTEVLWMKKFDGIMFSSTRISEREVYSTAVYQVNRHRENIALFTSYNIDNYYDISLRNKFLISKPQCESDLVDLTLDDIKEITGQIVSLKEHYKPPFPFPFRGDEIFAIKSMTRLEKLVIKDLNGQETLYFDHKIGKMHIQLSYQNLLDFRNRMMPHT